MFILSQYQQEWMGFSPFFVSAVNPTTVMQLRTHHTIYVQQQQQQMSQTKSKVLVSPSQSTSFRNSSFLSGSMQEDRKYKLQGHLEWNSNSELQIDP